MNETTWWIITSLLGLLVLIAGWALRSVVSTINKRLNIVEQEIKEIKENYLERFNKVNTHIVESKEEIIGKLHKLELSINATTAANLIKETALAVALALKEQK